MRESGGGVISQRPARLSEYLRACHPTRNPSCNDALVRQFAVLPQQAAVSPENWAYLLGQKLVHLLGCPANQDGGTCHGLEINAGKRGVGAQTVAPVVPRRALRARRCHAMAILSRPLVHL